MNDSFIIKLSMRLEERFPWKSFFFLFVLIHGSLPLLAQTSTANNNQHPRSYQERWNEIKKNCLEEAEKFQCDFKTTSDVSYRRHNGFFTVKKVFHAGYWFTNSFTFFIPFLKDSVDEYLSNPDHPVRCEYLPSSYQHWREMLKEIKMTAKEKNLNECQKACVSVCTSSYALTFDARISAFDGTCPSIIEAGKGDCKRFSKLAKNIGEKLGLNIRRVNSQTHQFIEVFLQGKWYKAEPQQHPVNHVCSFYSYKPKKNLAKQNAVIKK